MKSVRVFALAWVFCGVAALLGAQGVQTGTIRGVVKDQQDLAVPGVTVTATSPALQGPRIDRHRRRGRLRASRRLPPGDYEVKFELRGSGPSRGTTAFRSA